MIQYVDTTWALKSSFKAHFYELAFLSDCYCKCKLLCNCFLGICLKVDFIGTCLFMSFFFCFKLKMLRWLVAVNMWDFFLEIYVCTFYFYFSEEVRVMSCVMLETTFCLFVCNFNQRMACRDIVDSAHLQTFMVPKCVWQTMKTLFSGCQKWPWSFLCKERK